MRGLVRSALAHLIVKSHLPGADVEKPSRAVLVEPLEHRHPAHWTGQCPGQQITRIEIEGSARDAGDDRRPWSVELDLLELLAKRLHRRLHRRGMKRARDR